MAFCVDLLIWPYFYTMHNKFSNCFYIGKPIHIRSQVSFAGMTIQPPNIWQEFPLKKKYGITTRSGRAKVTLSFKANG